MSDVVHRPSGDPARSEQLGPYRIEALLSRDEARAGTVYRVHIAAGQTTAVSYHRVAEEYYFVLAGGGVAVLDGREYPLRPGDFLRLPPGTRHGFVAGAEGLDLLDPGSDGLLVSPPSPTDPARVRTGPRVGVSGPGGDGQAYPWRFWLDDEPTVSTYRPAVPRRRTRGPRPPAGP